jgi:hypothetical protein
MERLSVKFRAEYFYHESSRNKQETNSEKNNTKTQTIK